MSNGNQETELRGGTRRPPRVKRVELFCKPDIQIDLAVRLSERQWEGLHSLAGVSTRHPLADRLLLFLTA